MYKHPGLLAKHIREGVPWVRRLEDNIPTDTIQEFCMVLWGTCPNAIPFEVPHSNTAGTHEMEAHGAITRKDALPERDESEIVMPIPFVTKSCETCLLLKKGDYMLLNLNAALQHSWSPYLGWEYYSPAPKVAKFTRPSGQHNATFQTQRPL